MPPFPGSRCRLWATLVCSAALLWAGAVSAEEGASQGSQKGMEQVLQGLGKASTVGKEPGARPGEGTVVGRVFDAGSGAPLERVTVLLKFPEKAGAKPHQEVRISDADGGFEFPSVPPGTYSIGFIKAGFRNSTMTGFLVQPDQINRADFPLPPQAAGENQDVIQLEEFVVEQETAAQMMTSLETRMDSDQLLNILSAEDLSKYAAGNVGEALQRVAGVNIVEGKFAVIRGLEDRYSSTLLNGAVVPSPDPDRQSVQLDLFPSEVVGDLTVTKTFSSELPSNSAGGTIDISTYSYPDVPLEVSLKAGAKVNDNARDRFIHMDGHTDVQRLIDGLDDPMPDFTALKANGYKLIGGNPVGIEGQHRSNFLRSLEDVLGHDFTATIGGRKEYNGREFRYKAVGSNEITYRSAFGFKNKREPRPPFKNPDTHSPIFDFSCFCFPLIPGEQLNTADLNFGELNLSDGRYDLAQSTRDEQTTGYASFGFDLDDKGNHKIDASVFWTQKSQETVQLEENGYLPDFKMDGFDSNGNQLDFSYSAAVDLQVAGHLPHLPDSNFVRFDTTRGSYIARTFREAVLDGASNGALVWDNFFQSRSFQRDRELRVIQLNGDHRFDELPGFHFTWAINRAETREDEAVLGMKYFFEPCGYGVPCDMGGTPLPPPTVFPVDSKALGPGQYIARNNLSLSANSIREKSKFFRFDGEYEIDFSEASKFTIAGGWWTERAERNVASVFLESPTVTKADPTTCVAGSTTQFVCLANTAQELGAGLFQHDLSTQGNNYDGLRHNTNESSREIDAWHVRGKLTFWDRLDMQGGARFEQIRIDSINDPFVLDPLTGQQVHRLGGVETFPSRFLFFDHRDNPFRFEVSRPPVEGTVFNDQLIGFQGLVPGPCAGDDGSLPGISCVDFTTREELKALFDGRIRDDRVLPFAGFAIRPVEGMSLRGAWSQTVARPSFREMGYYVSLDIDSDDRIVGNPQVGLSDVESWDARAEYTWGSRGDLMAFSWFRKTIQRPIETIILRDPIDDSFKGTLYRTFFNNPNTADLAGIEIEARKSFDFLSSWWNAPEFFRYLSIGGNYTMIDASVDRTQAELARADAFFYALPQDQGRTPFTHLEKTRRLYGQPEWIANADITLDYPDWGTKLTFAWFAISDVLDAAGTASIAPSGDLISFTLDRYLDAYDEFRVVASQTFHLPGEFGDLILKFSAKNLTDSERRIVYDPNQTVERIPERSLNLGRNYDVSLTYTRRF